MLNIIFASFFLAAFVSACFQSVVFADYQIWSIIVNEIFSAAKSAFTISINLTGMLCLWLGLLKIAEQSGLTDILAKALKPLFKKIMPEVPDNHPAIGSIVMNMAANILGLDNAATPMGLKAMEQLQELNPKKDTATNAQIMFMVINASSVTIIPISILMYRNELGSTNPSAVFIPILLATSLSTLAGFLSVALTQKLPIFNKIVLTYIGGFTVFIFLIAYCFISLDDNMRMSVSTTAGNFILYFIVCTFIFAGLVKKLNVYETFIEGAKQGFDIAVKIIPYLVAMLVAIAAFKASGLLEMFTDSIAWLLQKIGTNTDFIPALPTAIMKPLSGSGARAMMIQALSTYGADSFAGFVASVIQGSTETTFYVLAVYFGAVKIIKTRQALGCALFADFVGIISAIILSYMFYQ
ncbi:MAG: hypothetical protein IJ019_00340 [Alphaproteobacteria bacterium]|nr:hypothetical protein [Alphaproteobacteria bacterium]